MVPMPRSEPKLRPLFQRLNEQAALGVGNPAQSFHHSLGVLAVAGEDGRGEPVLGKIVVSGAGLTPKGPQDAATPIASPHGIGIKGQGWQGVGARHMD